MGLYIRKFVQMEGFCGWMLLLLGARGGIMVTPRSGPPPQTQMPLHDKPGLHRPTEHEPTM